MSVKIEESVAKLAEQYEETARGPSPGWIGAEVVAKQLRSILAAPVVERQPVELLQVVREAMEGCYRDGKSDFRCSKNERIEETLQAIREHTAPPELAELQATIDHLRNDLEGTRLLSADQLLKINRLTAEIERLKGGQGEAK